MVVFILELITNLCSFFVVKINFTVKQKVKDFKKFNTPFKRSKATPVASLANPPFMRKNMLENLDDIVLVESESENVVEKVNILGDEIVATDDVPLRVPEVGMKFNDENELFDYYKKFAYAEGFPFRKRNSKKDDDGIVRYVTLTCSREGKRSSTTIGSLKPQPTIQTGCKARLTASMDSRGIWRINIVNLEHNHKTSPSKSRLYRCNRELSAHVKRRLQVNDMAGIPLHKSFNSAVVEAGGYENMACMEKDCRNYIEQVRRLRLREGDAVAIQSYFSKMQATCAPFYFSMDLDEDSRLKNVFWADNRSRQAYKEFGDVVTFDTTYLTNKYDMPFAPFVGINHHGQSTLLGCGLVSNEDTDTFVWLFRTWLQCMHGKAPQGIITDQDKAMQNAIAIVFPDTKHRWCLWHILKKLPEKFGYHVDKGSIFHAIHGLVYDSQFVEEFEDGWRVMIGTYDLYDNAWLSGLYDNRCRWVPRVSLSLKAQLVFAEPKFPCYFIFGDSLVDNGNNNNLNTSANFNYLPYGIDFPQGPTGRFTNGKNIADLIGYSSHFPLLTSCFL
ncbi:protein FAR1-RELATED SEQUENCE 5-like [Olea europaea var. sylvestris]|uniref:protein FAR1-RELATED SEQUENCE 5-like n=1 Tax=Olea europaea var. sylvestris TaxID=158386 RepID=UPI000C1D0729|nr:protein FAR1-RELATED SEQUENCE 5-like [Olea europaea var. sylvestris]